jgi:hypothetical protein
MSQSPKAVLVAEYCNRKISIHLPKLGVIKWRAEQCSLISEQSIEAYTNHAALGLTSVR